MASTCALLQVDCWSSMRRVELLQQHLRYSLDELQVGQAVDEDSTTTTECCSLGIPVGSIFDWSKLVCWPPVGLTSCYNALRRDMLFQYKWPAYSFVVSVRQLKVVLACKNSCDWTSRCWKSVLGAPGMCSCMLGRNFSFESIDEPMTSDMPWFLHVRSLQLLDVFFLSLLLMVFDLLSDIFQE
ncbi:hypothetical protein TRIUR3_22866 [Triticum urartu]|uniref:Uncharacterized protein n=1 Tax=Triticum urartu TaxID=4572 RepID=M7Y6Q7_TRIUA|nr:hypothetical protein TRIUR3_22866 [Triticum urartu]